MDFSGVHVESKEELSVSALGCLMPFLAQHAGYYSGWIFCNEYSVVDFTNLDYMVRETNKVIFQRWCPGLMQDLVEIIENDKDQIAVITWKRKVKNQLKKRLPSSFYQCGKEMWHKIRGHKKQ